MFGSASDPLPLQKGLSRKHVHDACHAALKRLRVDYLDLYFCHRPDPDVPVLKADFGACQGYANCVDAAPDTYDIDDDGVNDFFVAAPSHTIDANNNADSNGRIDGFSRIWTRLASGAPGSASMALNSVRTDHLNGSQWNRE